MQGRILNHGFTRMNTDSKIAIIMSREEVAALPQARRPLNFRVPSKIYHDVFEAVGAASVCWCPLPGDQVFDAERASSVAVDLCFKIAEELERLGVPPEKINSLAPPQPDIRVDQGGAAATALPGKEGSANA